MPHDEDRILKEHRNFWRKARADRLRFIVDAAEYFELFAETVKNAEKTVKILAWEVNSGIKLKRNGGGDEYPAELDRFLTEVSRRNKDLHMYILEWDFAMMYMPNRSIAPLFQSKWHDCRRIHFKYDGNHPVGASHHQKVIVVDDRVAFTGGLDLAASRWDTPEHRYSDSRRSDPEDERYPPYHDLMVMVEGPAAEVLGDLAARRWKIACGKDIPAVNRDSSPWPESIDAHLTDVDTAVSRTEPDFNGLEEVREIEHLYLDGIARARDLIYIENQYLTDMDIAEALGKRLSEPDGPEVVALTRRESRGWLEFLSMDILRKRWIRRVRAMDRYGRFHLYAPVSRRDGDVETVNLHSKLIMIDDGFVSIGSANICNRSMGLDTECNVSVESGGERKTEECIENLRLKLIFEHAGLPKDETKKLIERSGSPGKAVARLAEKTGNLVPLGENLSHIMDRMLPGEDVLDPEKPITAGEIMDKREIENPGNSKLSMIVRIAVTAVFLAGLAAAWRWTPLGEWLAPDLLADGLSPIQNSPFGPVMVIAFFVVGGLMMVPVTAMILATGLIYGSPEGFGYALVGSILAALAGYVAGGLLWRDAVRTLAGKKLNRISWRLAKQGVIVVILSRVVPVAPFTVINMVAGSSHIRLRDFILGTVLGMAPGTFLITMFADQAFSALLDPDPISVWNAVGVLLVFILSAYLVQRRLEPGPAPE